MTNDGIYKTVRIKEIRNEAVDFKTFLFEDGHGIRYQAGQYLTLVTFQNGHEIRRSYSITSAPGLGEPLSIGVKRVANGAVSRFLIDDAKPGDAWLTAGSGGLLVLPENNTKYNQLFFFAAGSGITPVFSLLKTALHLHPQFSVVLIYSNASLDKTVFLQPLQTLQQQYSRRFHIKWLFSTSSDLSKARLHRDLLLHLLYQFGDKNLDRILFYICGPESYMRLCTYTLQEQGIDLNNIKKEHFDTATVTRRDASPPDKTTRIVSIRFNNKEYTITVLYPDAILKAAKKAGLILPYSCEVGRCGNCIAKCESGTIWHSNNEVLTDNELQQGWVLTCVGHPVGGDATLVI